ncbi:hypothetical protein SAMCCGM7_pB0256 (plasmid) [Sinorhizobium americanum CCGM7]|nr:hypothetical protein SAMCCGM7_pB0256 [Sinorhizobium americanum CCGM7]
MKIFPGIGPIVGTTQAEADQVIRNLISIEEALAYLGRSSTAQPCTARNTISTTRSLRRPPGSGCGSLRLSCPDQPKERI